MNSRERTLVALSHREPDKVPVCLAYETPKEIAERYGREVEPSRMRQDIYAARLAEPPPPPGIREQYLEDLPEKASVDAWGVARWYSSTGNSHAVVGPLRHMRRTSELEAYPFPDVVNDESAADLARQVQQLHDRGVAVQGAMSQTIWELAWAMYGMQNLMLAMYDNPSFVHVLFAEIATRKRDVAVQYARAGVDILRLGDDVGTQRGMMIDPALWRTFLKPLFADIIAAARAERPGIPVFYHSDGDIREIIDELIEIGVTILNPVQPECMDPIEIKRRYGDRLTLWGTIGTQSVLPLGTPAQVRQTVKEYIAALAPGGGYVIGPTHSINQDVPWDNIAAFYDAVECFGAYGG